jgi:hypothetical protein
MMRVFAGPMHYDVSVIAPLRHIEFDQIIDVETEVTLMILVV